MYIRILTRSLASFLIAAATLSLSAAENPFLGQWELTIPGGGAGWLGVEEKNGALEAKLLWGSGSVLPLASAKVENDHLLLIRKHQIERLVEGKKTKVTLIETLTGSVE